MTKKEKAIICKYEEELWNEIKEATTYGFKEEYINNLKYKWYGVHSIIEKLGIEEI